MLAVEEFQFKLVDKISKVNATIKARTILNDTIYFL